MITEFKYSDFETFSRLFDDLKGFERTPDEDEAVCDLLFLVGALSHTESEAAAVKSIVERLQRNGLLSWRHEVSLADYCERREAWVSEVVARDKEGVPLDPFRYGAARTEHLIHYIGNTVWSETAKAWLREVLEAIPPESTCRSALASLYDSI